MCCDLRSPLILRIMGLGFSLHEAERIAASIMTGVVIVVTIMGYAIRSPADENQPGQRKRIRSDTSGIHHGITGSQCCGFGNIVVDALRRFPALLTIPCRVPA